jgi:two-component system response regulator RegX3
MKRILVVEDEDTIRDFVIINLRRAGYEVAEASSGEEALKIFEESADFDIVLLDIMLPGMDGFAVCRRLREKNSMLGIMMLTARTQEMDKINGLMIGADDYVPKPFSPGELMARIDALYRRVTMARGEAHTNENIISGPFTLNLKSRIIKKDGMPIEVTQVEYQIMRHFMENPETALSRNEILNHVWGDGYYGELKIVDVNIRRLRMKIEEDASNPQYIQTVWGFGYKLQVRN